jgi:hypothetical protein
MFSVSEEDRRAFDKIEYAGDDMAWSVVCDPGIESQHVLHISASGKRQGIAVNAPVLLFGRNLTVLDDGSVTLWSPNEDSGDFLLLPKFHDKSILRKHVSVLPVHTESGIPMMVNPVVEAIIHAVEGRTKSRVGGISPPSGYL